MAQPIWKDYFVDFGELDAVNYTVKVGGEAIFEGRAVRKPMEDSLLVRINDVCESYLVSSLPAMKDDTFTSAYISRVFEVYKDGFLYTTVTFSLDYSYDATKTDTIASFPILPILHINQPLIYTQYETSAIDVIITKTNGTKKTLTITTAGGGDYNNDYNDDFLHDGQPGSVYVNLATHEAKKVNIRTLAYDVVNTCDRYALYYVNAYGGWDSLLLQGRADEKDTITRKEVTYTYNNRNTHDRARTNYLNEIVKTYTLRTGWLTDAQAAKMWHLLESTNVYLYDIVKKQMHSCIITNAEAPFKTFKGEGGKLVSYELNVELSQGRVRR